MTVPARRRLAYVAVGAVGTLVVVVVALFFLEEGLDNSSKVAGIAGLFVSIAMAIWTIWQAKRARQEEAVPDTPPDSSDPPPANSRNTPSRSGSKFGEVSVKNAGKV